MDLIAPASSPPPSQNYEAEDEADQQRGWEETKLQLAMMLVSMKESTKKMHSSVEKAHAWADSIESRVSYAHLYDTPMTPPHMPDSVIQALEEWDRF